MKRLMVAAVLFCAMSEANAGSCEFVIRWDEQALSACIEELNKSKTALEADYNQLYGEHMILRKEVCLLANIVKKSQSDDMLKVIIQDACAVFKGSKDAVRPAR